MNKESLSAGRVTNGLGSRVIGQKILHYPSLPSTMEAARKEASKKAQEGTVIIADEQTAGRGRLGRTWLSPQGSVSMSVILYPDRARLPRFIMIAGLAAARSVAAATGLDARLKWPNDVVIDGRKVAGILIESSLREEAVDHAIIGIGVNVNVDVSAYPEIATTASSLSSELGSPVSRLEVVRRLLRELDSLYRAPQEAVYEEWLSLLTTLGRRVCVVYGNTVQYGRAEGVAGDGSLLLRLDDASITRVLAGDVSLRDIAADGNA